MNIRTVFTATALGSLVGAGTGRSIAIGAGAIVGVIVRFVRGHV